MSAASLGLRLKVKLSAQLQLSRITGNIDPAEVGAATIPIADARIAHTSTAGIAAKLNTIKRVETFQTKLQTLALREIEILEERKTPVLVAWAAKFITGCVTQGSWASCLKSRWVDPFEG